MIKTKFSRYFKKQMASLMKRDKVTASRILARIDYIEATGNLGQHRERIKGRVSELKLSFGAGHRIYYIKRGDILIIILLVGTKRTQKRDIDIAYIMSEKLK